MSDIHNSVVLLENIKQFGKPSHDLLRANYNRLIILTGNAYNLGYQLGYQLANGINDAVRWTVLSSIQFGMGHDHFTAREKILVVDALVIINEWLYYEFYSRAIPDLYKIEANAVVQGANDAGLTNINIGHIATINFMADLMNSLLNESYMPSLSVLNRLKSLFKNQYHSKYASLPIAQMIAVDWFFVNFGSKFVIEYNGCDAYTTSNHRNDQQYRYFTRFLQFPSVHYLFYDIVYPVIRKPTDGRYKSIGWLIPGMIGSYTSMNECKVCTALNYFRSEAVSVSDSGLTSIMVLRIIADSAKNTANAIAIVRTSRRGSPYFITIFDNITAVVCEIFGSSVNLSNVKKYVIDNSVKKIIPTNFELFENSPQVENNVIVRTSSFEIDRPLFIRTNKLIVRLCRNL